MLRTFTTKIKSIVSIKIKHRNNPHIKTLFNVEENYTYSKHTINKINKQKKKRCHSSILAVSSWR
jgi:hypothetical protein